MIKTKEAQENYNLLKSGKTLEIEGCNCGLFSASIKDGIISVAVLKIADKSIIAIRKLDKITVMTLLGYARKVTEK